MSIKVESKVTIYEKDGEDTKGLVLPTLTVSSHWSDRDRVVLEVDGHTYDVVAQDLEAAIANATRVGSR